MDPRVVVVLFVMEGCPACEEYFPRFQRLAGPYQNAGLPVFVYDAASEDPNIQGLADRWGIEATPTTIVARRGPGMIREEGALSDTEIGQLLATAMHVHQYGYGY